MVMLMSDSCGCQDDRRGTDSAVGCGVSRLWLRARWRTDGRFYANSRKGIVPCRLPRDPQGRGRSLLAFGGGSGWCRSLTPLSECVRPFLWGDASHEELAFDWVEIREAVLNVVATLPLEVLLGGDG